MTNEPRGSFGGAGWVGIVAGLAAAAILFGMREVGSVEVFGLDLPILVVGLVLWFLGFMGGTFSRRRRV